MSNKDQLIRCKACGYIMREDLVKEVCPACGLPKSVFEPYRENISPRRRLILGLHLHPIAVHFPQALVVLLFPLLLLGRFLPAPWGHDCIVTSRVLVYLLPLLTLPALISGIIDGRVRFKKLGTPALKQKILLGSLFFLLNTAAAGLAYLRGLEGSILYGVLALLIPCMACQALLGRIGVRLMFARLGG